MAGGPLCFVERNVVGEFRELKVPCGQCIGCRLERSRQTAVRCMHEASLHSENCFLTLTYADSFVGESLFYPDFQRFVKRLRARLRARISYYVAGEYGAIFFRPHFHAIVFGVSFSDMVYHAKLPSGFKVYRSPVLESLWPHGFSSIGAVTFESAAYCARYCMDKLTGRRVLVSEKLGRRIDLETGELLPLVPEFCHWSLKPAIGKRWLEKYHSDVYRSQDGKVVARGGVASRAPRFYDKWYSNFDPERMAMIKDAREEEALAQVADQHWKRLEVRETVTAARVSLLKRSMEIV